MPQRNAGLVEPVQVVLYGESLCPSCTYCVENVVGPMFDQGLNEDVFRFKYFAYGNARNQSDVSRLLVLSAAQKIWPVLSFVFIIARSQPDAPDLFDSSDGAPTEDSSSHKRIWAVCDAS